MMVVASHGRVVFTPGHLRRGVSQPQAARPAARRHARRAGGHRIAAAGLVDRRACHRRARRLDGARLVRRQLGTRRAVDSVDPRAGADRGQQHGTDRHHAVRLTVQDPAVHVWCARPALAGDEPDDGGHVGGSGQQRLEPAHGHQAGVHARREAAPASRWPRDRHHRGRACGDAAVLPVVRAQSLRCRDGGQRGGHDGQREIRVPGGTAMERRVRPGDRHLRRRSRTRLAVHAPSSGRW